MRLLSIDEHGDFRLTTFSNKNVKPYAILSHTWNVINNEEVSYEDIDEKKGKTKFGYEKLKFCGKQAKKDGLEYFWVDTCCINKSDQRELQEAITSMYRWYSRAKVCYVYLSDVSALKRNHEGEHLIRGSLWFTRGWTLQELLAPYTVRFFSEEGDLLGDKSTLKTMIEEVTGIPGRALESNDFDEFSIQERLRWASKRRTTLFEDKAYCLQGIFDVYMLPNYGEEKNSFRRLIRKILKKYNVDLQRYEDEFFSSTMNYRNCDEEEIDPAFHNLATGRHPRTHDDNDRQKHIELGKAEGEEVERQGQLDEHRKTLLESLHFAQMDSRRDTIKQAYKTTCAWFLNNQSYVDWTDPNEYESHHGFLWLKGNPGTGKSTLVKYAWAFAEDYKADDEIVVSFFFNARGEDLEKSTTGMYRAILLQILNKCPALQRLLDDFPHNPANVWTVDSLHDLLSLLIRELGGRRLKCFIDALDEGDEDQMRQMLYNFEELAKHSGLPKHRFYIFFASRHYPTINIEDGLEIILENESGHAQDIKAYILRHLQVRKSGPEGHARVEAMRDKIQEKANGIFLWTALVIDMLNKEYERGAIFAVKKRLEEVPTGLSDLFKDIVTRDSENLKEFLLCLQWILFARRPLKTDEFYFAMLVGIDADPENLEKRDEITMDDMTAFVRSSSKGLAEVTRSSKPTVQFIHESVKDYLVKDGAIKDLWPSEKNDRTSSGHNELKRCCCAYLAADLSRYIPALDKLPKASTYEGKLLRANLLRDFPLLEYASKYIFYHAEEAADAISQDEFLRRFPVVTWVVINNALQKYEIDRHKLWEQSVETLFYILAEHDCPRLIKTVFAINERQTSPSDPLLWKPTGARYIYPLLAAFANGSKKAIRDIWGSSENVNLIQEVVSDPKYGSPISIQPNRWPLIWALEQGRVALARLIMSTAYNNIPSPYVNSGTDYRMEDKKSMQKYQGALSLLAELNAPGSIVSFDSEGRYERSKQESLISAAKEGKLAILEFLLDNGVDVDSGNRYGSALGQAVLYRQDHVTKVLVERGANVKQRIERGRTFLHWLLRSHRKISEDLVRLFLSNGAGVDDKDFDGKTTMHHAAEFDQEKTVGILLEYGADVSSKDVHGGTPLHAAVFNDHQATIRRLLEYEANIESKDLQGMTPLSFAIRYGYDDPTDQYDVTGSTSFHIPNCQGNVKTVQLLLVHGADAVSMDDCGNTPLHFAADQRRLQAMSLLYGSRVNLDARNNDGQTPLHLAASEFALKIQGLHDGWRVERFKRVKSVHVVKFLLSHGAKVDEQDTEKRTPLHYAAGDGLVETVQALLTHGATIDAEDTHKRTPIHHAARQGHVTTFRLLLEHGADFDRAVAQKRTLLHDAAEGGKVEIIQSLLELGLSIDGEDEFGYTPLDLTNRSDDTTAFNFLFNNLCRANGTEGLK
ncbi:Hypothetical protein R9X50_00554600 [Acrodontium crateriforme]|uniref:Heterokaryon incompatibility domain-containing protein n=1 Tax=Acrodontium crateriforme TaxID=150365 RepID=A0AAQ3M7D6_9PEZI|nr:Hypothetical protein R9X50_00554600 [Acrodontium crateriforme]